MASKEIKGKFKPSVSAENAFYRALKKVARHAGHIIEHHLDGVEIKDQSQMMKSLMEYSKLIEPWAVRQSDKLFETVLRSNQRAYDRASKALGKELRKQFSVKTLIGARVRELQKEQLFLIKSIPIEAGQRAQKLALEAALAGQRALPDQKTISEIKNQLDVSTEVATARAKVIAVTETAKANAFINQARAEGVGSTHYIWHTSGDAAVRPSHKVMNKRKIAWNEPPTLDDGMTGHAGCFPNCRCFAEPILPNV